MSPEAFFPRPKVRSTVLKIELFSEPLIAANEMPALRGLVRAAFGQRRKTLAMLWHRRRDVRAPRSKSFSKVKISIRSDAARRLSVDEYRQARPRRAQSQSAAINRIADNQQLIPMPELPEVETVCRSLRPHLVGRTIARIEVIEPRLRVLVDVVALASLAGKRVEQISRIAKYIVLQLSDDAVWLFHLGMSGKLICAAPDTARRKHDHIVVDLDDGVELRYHDPRRFGLSIASNHSVLNDLPQLRHLGIDPFDAALTGEYLFKLYSLFGAAHPRSIARPADHRRSRQHLR